MIELATIPTMVLALVEIAKKAGVDSRYAPILSIVLGVAAFMVWGDGTWQSDLFLGLVAGLTASGAYSGFKRQFYE